MERKHPMEMLLRAWKIICCCTLRVGTF
jgi:hypothetical protein